MASFTTHCSVAIFCAINMLLADADWSVMFIAKTISNAIVAKFKFLFFISCFVIEKIRNLNIFILIDRMLTALILDKNI